MNRINEIIQNANGYMLLFCLSYSFALGCFFPDIWDKIYDRKKISRLAVIQFLRANGSFALTLAICCIPGIILALNGHKDYLGVSFVFFVLGGLFRRIFHETKIWRGPPWF
jgi:hypothetical protein